MKTYLRCILALLVFARCSPVTKPPPPPGPSGWVTGQVSGQLNLPVPYYGVVLSNGSRSHSVITDWGGHFTFSGIPVGDYELSVDSIVLSSATVVDAETTDVGKLYALDSILPCDFSFLSAFVRHHGQSEYGDWFPGYGVGQPITLYSSSDSIDIAAEAVGNLTNGPWILSTKDVVQIFLNGEKLGDSCRMSNGLYISAPFHPRGSDTIDLCGPCEKVLQSSVNRCPRGRIFVRHLPKSGFKDTTEPFTCALIALDAHSGDTVADWSVTDRMPVIIPSGDVKVWLVPGKLFQWTKVLYDGRTVYDSLPHWQGVGSLSPDVADDIYCGRLSHSSRDSLVISTRSSFGLDTVRRVGLASTIYLISPAVADTSSENFWTHVFVADAANDTCIYAKADCWQNLTVNAISGADSVTIWFWVPNIQFFGVIFHIFHNGKQIADLDPDTSYGGVLKTPVIGLTDSDTVVAETDALAGVSEYYRFIATVFVTRPSPLQPGHRLTLDSVEEIPPPPCTSTGLKPLLFVTTGSAYLTAQRDSVMVSSSRLPLDGDTFYVAYDRTSPIEWKISFDASPAAAYLLPSVVPWIDSTAQGLGLKFTAIPALTNADTSQVSGVSKIFVTYEYGPRDSTVATPQLVIACGTPGVLPGSTGLLLSAVYQVSPATPLRKGETWYAGDLQIPKMTFKPAGPVKLSKVRVRP